MRSGRRRDLLVEPPTSATGDIAFNLIVFFLVCASVQPDSGRKQTIPSSETVDEEQEDQNLEVRLTRTSVIVNGEVVEPARFDSVLAARLQGQTRPEDRVVVVKSDKELPYDRWIEFTSRIEDAGGTITLQLEEERQVVVP